jgi:metallo-beta-lactamase family protein
MKTCSNSYLVHGEHQVQEHFAKKLNNAGFFNVEIPYQYQRIYLGDEATAVPLTD